ncbi:Epsin-3, clathrin recruitment and traffic between the Golgi and endosome [Loxospora ochrophaea]|nr:Epsin-3, clathrin recruitment and traffic between the Golgi and endosome [Loxospora ochrophaea]
MDFNSLKDQVSNLTLYDLKAGVRKVQNAVMNYTEMEAKVREATNNEPWGASSTLMQDIANGTYSYQLLNEIMPMIYKRFTEKAAEEWRQIYKGLQLLEFLIKNGSERVVDDARSHLSLLKMLRQFHFIDQNGKDQGINVRNRAKELADLLSDVERIRAERKKARSNRNKFGGVEGGMSSGLSSGSRYGGFGSEDSGGYGGYSGGVYGDGGGFGGNTSGFQDTSSRRDRFEEYDEYDEGAGSSSSRRKPELDTSTPIRRETKKAETPKQPEPQEDLFDFGADDLPPKTPPKPSVSNGKSTITSPLDSSVAADDDFDDFITADPVPQASSRPSIPGSIQPPVQTISTAAITQVAAPKPVSGVQGASIGDIVGFSSPAPSISTMATPVPSFSTMSTPAPSAFASPAPLAQQPPPLSRPTGYQAAQPNYFTSVPAPQSTASPASASKPSLSSTPSFSTKPAAKSSAASGDAFGSLWSTASAGAGIKKTSTPGAAGPNLASMAKEKASAGIWGATQTPPASQAQSTMPPQQSSTGGIGGGLDDLLG